MTGIFAFCGFTAYLLHVAITRPLCRVLGWA